jgi:flotillin
VQRLGEEVGLNIGDGVRGLAAQLDRRGNGAGPVKKTGKSKPAKED